MEGSSTVTALTTFANTITGQISATEVLSVLGVAVGAGFAIYLVRWGAKLVVNKFVGGLNGKIRG